LGLFDLKYNPDDYLDLPVEKLVEVMNGSNKAIRCIRANNQPILLPLALAPPALYALSITTAELQRRAKVISQSTDFRCRVGEAIANRYPPRETSLYVEEQIYERFPSKTDEFLMDQFHRTAWERRPELVEQLSDRRLRELGLRLIYIERPDALCAEKRRELERWHNERLNPTCDVPWLTVAGALSEAEKLHQVDSESRELLSNLLDWLRARSPPTRADLSNGHRGRGPPQRKTADAILFVFDTGAAINSDARRPTGRVEALGGLRKHHRETRNPGGQRLTRTTSSKKTRLIPHRPFCHSRPVRRRRRAGEEADAESRRCQPHQSVRCHS
jgi:hypothetical protein